MNATTSIARLRAGLARLAVAAIAAFALAAALAATAPAAEAAPELRALPEFPANVEPGTFTRGNIFVQNTGDAATTGPVSVEIEMPAGLGFLAATGASCTPSGATVDCTVSGPITRRAYAGIAVTASAGASASGPQEIAVSAGGGGAAPVATSETVNVGSPPFDRGVRGWDVSMSAAAAGGAATQAGSHPRSLTTTLGFLTDTSHVFFGLPVERPLGQLKDIGVDIPLGLVGNPGATAVRCSTQDWIDGGDSQQTNCPRDSQVGIARLRSTVAALFNVEPPHGAAAAFGFQVQGVPVLIAAELRNDGTYGIRVVSRDTATTVPIPGVEVTFWGVPADPSHDYERGGDCMLANQLGANGSVCETDAPLEAFLTAPTRCSGANAFDVAYNTHERPGEFHEASASLPAFTGCDRVPFEPSFSAQPTSTTADDPTGLDVELAIPQDTNPDGLAQSHLKRVTVTLPEGMTISPSSAHGLVACTDAQLGIGEDRPARCPAGSKIGSMELETPLLEETIGGAVYVRSQASDDPASGELFRIAIELRNEARGIDIKLPGSVVASPDTGRLKVTFDDNPQLPFSSLRMELKSGSRAPLANPTDCGPKTIVAELEGWSGKTVQRTDSYTIACPGSTGFAPSFAGGSVSPVGGVFSPLVVRVGRGDRQEFLSGVDVRMPEGVLADLSSVERCADGPAAGGGCPAGSRIGTATVGAGPGSDPFYLSGDVFLTDGYRGAPFGLAVHVRAVAGPFDLGWVRVRQALHVDPETTRVRVVSDPLPQIVKGVPVRLRDVRVDVDREGFAVNPTSCVERRVGAALTSIRGSVHQTGSRFQVGDCASLGFRPRLGMRLFGPRQRKTGGHPALKAVVRQGDGEANISRARVVLPRSIALDAENSNDPELLCDFDAATVRAECPESTVIGKARAVSPLLKQPLMGPVHLVQGIRVTEQGNRVRTTPGLLVKLHGEVDINLHAKSTARKGLLISRFLKVPDARVSRFALRINGGPKGILVVTRTRQSKIDLCDSRQTARVRMAGHNDRNARFKTRVRTPCGRKGRNAKRAARAKANRKAARRRAARRDD